MNEEKNVDVFRVIVVGGGPVGLVAAHALHLAGIDFVLLERRRSIVEDKGASLVVYPTTFRVLHQFGVLDEVLALGGELHHHLSFTADGHVFKEGTRYERLRKNHGYGPVALHRADLIKIMYEGLPAAAKAKVLTDKNVIKLECNGDSVKVICADGYLCCGSIVIGADGVHSKIRHLMRELAIQGGKPQTWIPKNPFSATYQLLYGSFPAPSESGFGYDCQMRDKAIMYLSGPKRAWFFLYKKLPEPSNKRVEYSDEDVEALAQEFAELPLTRTVKVKDVWPEMLGAGMTNLEEGILQHWSFGRITLAGDACHKFTTHLGLGFNNGVQDMVVLCNSLRRVVRLAPAGNPSTSTIRQVFEAYETSRKSSACSLVADLANSSMETRMHTWHNTWYFVLSRYLAMPNFIEDMVLRTVISPQLRKAQVLDYVFKEERMKGQMSWLHPIAPRVVT